MWSVYELGLELQADGLDKLRGLRVSMPGRAKVLSPDVSTHPLVEPAAVDAATVMWRTGPASTGSGATSSDAPSISFLVRSTRVNVERILMALVFIFGAGFVTKLLSALLKKR